MANQGITGTFLQHAFLAGLSERHLLMLASGARPFTAAPGELLAGEGDSARYFYLIQSGHVDINLHDSKRGDVLIDTVGPGEELGWSWLVPPHRWQYNCRAKDAVQGIRFDAEWLREKCEQDHELGYHLLKQMVSVIASRLASTRVKMLQQQK
jgi:CRP/FNR family transcriptional regulator, cyclic AMP receptor protein